MLYLLAGVPDMRAEMGRATMSNLNCLRRSKHFSSSKGHAFVTKMLRKCFYPDDGVEGLVLVLSRSKNATVVVDRYHCILSLECLIAFPYHRWTEASSPLRAFPSPKPNHLAILVVVPHLLEAYKWLNMCFCTCPTHSCLMIGWLTL